MKPAVNSMASDFSQQVWRLTRQIPRGRVSTYGLVAKALGKPQAARAVGNALNHNPYAPHVPCHRIVRSNGLLGGYAGGGRKKTALLAQEGVLVKNGRVENFKDKVFKFFQSKRLE